METANNEMQKLLEDMEETAKYFKTWRPAILSEMTFNVRNLPALLDYIRTLEKAAKRPHDLDAAYDDLHERSQILKKEYREMQQFLIKQGTDGFEDDMQESDERLRILSSLTFHP